MKLTRILFGPILFGPILFGPILFGMMALLALTINVAAQAQSNDKVMDWADQWQIATKQLLGVAETMPAGKYDYKPVKEVDTFGVQIKHATIAMKVLLANAEGKTVQVNEAISAIEKLKKKEEIIAEFRKTAEEGATVIARVAGKNDGDVVQSQFFGKTTRRFLLIQAIAHNNNHYGQLVYFLRLNGLTPPASR